MNRTTTVVVALIAAAGLSTMVYAVPAQRALAWGGGFGFAGCGFGCGGPFFVHKVIIQTISQTNRCINPTAPTPPTPPTPPLLPTDKGFAKGGMGGSGGAGGSGGEGGQGGKNVGDNTSTSKADINQKANGGNSNGGHAGNANGGDARINGNSDDQKPWGSDQQDQNQQAGGSDQQDQNQNRVVCLNTAVNTAGHGLGANGVGSGNLGNTGSGNLGGSDVPDNLLP
jgi:hypothetical protein